MLQRCEQLLRQPALASPSLRGNRRKRTEGRKEGLWASKRVHCPGFPHPTHCLGYQGPPKFPHDLRHRGSDGGACEQKSCRVPAQSFVFACLDIGKAPPLIVQKRAGVQGNSNHGFHTAGYDSLWGEVGMWGPWSQYGHTKGEEIKDSGRSKGYIRRKDANKENMQKSGMSKIAISQ